MDTSMYKWLWTALITPFKEGNWIDNEIDYDALDKILDMQIEGWVTWVLLLWTTWENPTLSNKESLNLVKFAVNKLKWNTKVMVNAGTYSTKASIDNIKEYDKIDWIDAYLVVNPYYNKPTQTGLKKHFTSIAKLTKKDIILYNIMWRTWVNLETDTLIDIIWESSNIIWVKEASWNMLQMKQVIEATWDHFIVLSWDDALTSELISHWGDWVISVASNCIPDKMSEFVEKCLSWSTEAVTLNDYYSDFFDKLFIQTNPLPAKTFLAKKWIIKEEFRLPICRMDNKEKKEFFESIKKYNF